MTAIPADDVESVVAAFATADPRVTEDNSFARLLKKASSKGDGRLCAYVRISQFRGLDESAGDIGIVRQARDICQLAVDDGVRIGTWHIDNDVSAASGRPRPGYESAFAMLASGRSTGLFAWDLVRLYRRGSELERLVELVESAPEELVVRTVKTGSNGIDLADPLGRMMARMMVWAAEMETFQQSSRQQASQRHRAQKGLWHGGTLPFGYRRRPAAPAPRATSTSSKKRPSSCAGGLLRSWRAHPCPASSPTSRPPGCGRTGPRAGPARSCGACT